MAQSCAPEKIARLTTDVIITKSLFAHVAKANGALAAAVDKEVVGSWMKFGASDHLSQILHVRRLNVNDV